MAGQRILFPEWRREHEATKYPFADRATLSNGSQTLLEGALVDAHLYPIGAVTALYLSRVVVTHDLVTVYVGDAEDAAIASGTFDVVQPPDEFKLVDAFGRPAGLFVSTSSGLSIITGWGVGDFRFNEDQTPFAATVCCPTPQVGVRGISLDDGTLLVGDVWLVGSDGVVLRHEEVTVPPARCGGQVVTYQVIRVDAVGDPLFRRRLCEPASLFETPRFLTQVTFRDRKQEFVCTPGENGDLKITGNNAKVPQPVMRIHPQPGGTKFEVVGSILQDVR